MQLNLQTTHRWVGEFLPRIPSMSGRRGWRQAERQALAGRRAVAAGDPPRCSGSGRPSIVAEEPGVVDLEIGLVGHVAHLDKAVSDLARSPSQAFMLLQLAIWRPNAWVAIAMMVKAWAGLTKLLMVTAGALPDVVTGSHAMPTSVVGSEDSKIWANDG